MTLGRFDVRQLLAALERNGVTREEVVNYLFRDVESKERIGDVLVLKARTDEPPIAEGAGANSIFLIGEREDGSFHFGHKCFVTSSAHFRFIGESYDDIKDLEVDIPESEVPFWFELGYKT